MSQNLKESYNRHFLFYELVLSIIVTLILFLLYQIKLFDIESWIEKNINSFYTIIAPISGTLLGFVITGVSILLAFPNSERLDKLRKSKHYKTVYEIYFSTVKYLAFTLILSIIGLLFNEELAIVLFYSVLWSIIISSLRVWRCVWVLKKIIDIMIEDNK